jgi:hypothetical protein
MTSLTTQEYDLSLADAVANGFDENHHDFNEPLNPKLGFFAKQGEIIVVHRIITVAALYLRLKGIGNKLPKLLAISDALAAQGNYELKAELMRIDKLEYFNLDDEAARPNFLETGQFTSDELDLLFVDGSIDEVPEAKK